MYIKYYICVCVCVYIYRNALVTAPLLLTFGYFGNIVVNLSPFILANFVDRHT